MIYLNANLIDAQVCVFLPLDKVDYMARDSRRAFGEAGVIDRIATRDLCVAWGDCSNPKKCYRCKNSLGSGELRSRMDGTGRGPPPSRNGKHLMIC